MKSLRLQRGKAHPQTSDGRERMSGIRGTLDGMYTQGRASYI